MSTALATENSRRLETLDVPVDRVSRLSVAQYHQMVRHGILRAGEPVELIDGLLVKKMGKNPPHVISLNHLRDRLLTLIGPRRHIRTQDPITLDFSEPEPDLAVVRGIVDDFREGHPGPADILLLAEVSDATLADDRGFKLRLFARNHIAEYWIVNLVDDQIEVYTHPSGPADEPGYAECRIYSAGQSVPLVLDGQTVGTIAVADVLP
jgi:Uma2 family endonuclease